MDQRYANDCAERRARVVKKLRTLPPGLSAHEYLRHFPNDVRLAMIQDILLRELKPCP